MSSTGPNGGRAGGPVTERTDPVTRRRLRVLRAEHPSGERTPRTRPLPLRSCLRSRLCNHLRGRLRSPWRPSAVGPATATCRCPGRWTPRQPTDVWAPLQGPHDSSYHRASDHFRYLRIEGGSPCMGCVARRSASRVGRGRRDTDQKRPVPDLEGQGPKGHVLSGKLGTRRKHALSRMAVGTAAMVLFSAGGMAGAAGTAPAAQPDPNAAPSTRPAAGPEDLSRVAAAGARPVSGTSPTAAPLSRNAAPGGFSG